jgi:hypothetical protein
MVALDLRKDGRRRKTVELCIATLVAVLTLYPRAFVARAARYWRGVAHNAARNCRTRQGFVPHAEKRLLAQTRSMSDRRDWPQASASR